MEIWTPQETNLIEELQDLIPEIHTDIKLYLDYPNDSWNSLIVDRRKPHTYRVFKMFGKRRVCLHMFYPCNHDECFEHPHGWPAAFLVLRGKYVHTLGCSNTLQGKPQFIYREIVTPYSMYEINNPFTWHKVQPLVPTYTIMMNGEEFELKHEETKTTKGKDLNKMDSHAMVQHMTIFDGLLTSYLAA